MTIKIERLNDFPSLTQVIRAHGLLQNSKHAKSFGQNFIVDPQILRKVVAAAGTLEQSLVIEIGPGPGGLTREILRAQPAHCIAIEKDATCCDVLAPLAELAEGHLEIRQADALTQIPLQHSPDIHDIKIISNLPYNVGTPILFKLLADPAPISTMVLMFQKEVADRILSPPGNKTYGRLSIIAQYCAEVARVCTLSAKAYMPPPKVCSSVVRFQMRKDRDLALLPALSKLTSVLFQNRRKMLRQSLKSVISAENLPFILQSVGIPEDIRPENLPVSKFVALAQAVLKHTNKFPQSIE